jgi:hypothetical protein
MRVTLDLQPAETHRFTFYVDGGDSIPIVLADEASEHRIATGFRGIPISLDRSNSFHLHYRWTDGTDWDVVVPSKPRPAAVIQRNGEQVATATFRFFRTWHVHCEGSDPETIRLKCGLFHERVVDQTGRQLANARAAPWAIRIPIDMSDDCYERIGSLIASVFLIAVAYRHLIDGD